MDSCKECSSTNIYPVRGEGPEQFMCENCNALYAVINGDTKLVPKAGSLDEWPELSEYFNSMIEIFFED